MYVAGPTHASELVPSSPFMDAVSVSFPTPTGLGSSVRKERGAIAAQACDTCRSRKQKCDELRPKCSTCQKFRLECNYREPQPTKKDKTLVEILERIKSLEGKIDRLGAPGALPSPFAPAPNHMTSARLAMSPELVGTVPESYHMTDSTSAGSGSEDVYRYAASVHEMLAWPVIQHVLDMATPKTTTHMPPTNRDGSVSVLNGQGLPGLPKDTALESLVPPLATGPMPITATSLNWETMQQLSKAYFDHYHFLHPILDRHTFISTTMVSVLNEGFRDDVATTIAFLVFALGEVAVAGTQGLPIHIYNNRPSGFRGGTRDQPPGLALFNEARRRMGFNLTECSLENVQIFALASLYYGTCSHHTEMWRMITSASLACQALITSDPSVLASPQADLVRRVFWHCSIIETSLHVELGLPLTGLDKLELLVGLPNFSSSFSQEDFFGNEGSHFKEHFASQIVLRRLLMSFHRILNHNSVPSAAFGSPPPQGPISQSSVTQLDLQLEQWFGMLPNYLRWRQDMPGAFPELVPDVYPAVTNFVAPLPQEAPADHVIPTEPALMLSTDLDAAPQTYPFANDVQIALLRTRYYYVKYLIHRPFIYKALHHPDSLTQEDCVAVATCLKSCLKWPITLSPPSRHKRLIPCLLFWSQNIVGILVLLHLSRTIPILHKIRSTLCGSRFELDANESVGLYIDWLRDNSMVDSGVHWCWYLIKSLYQLEGSP